MPSYCGTDSALQSNGYPKRFILDASSFKPSVKDTTPLAESVRRYSTIPYVSGTSEPIREFWKTMASKWHLNPIRQLARCFQNRKTKWIKKILVIPFTTFHVLIAARVTLAKRRENSKQEKANTKRLSHGDKAKNQHLQTT